MALPFSLFCAVSTSGFADPVAPVAPTHTDVNVEAAGPTARKITPLNIDGSEWRLLDTFRKACRPLSASDLVQVIQKSLQKNIDVAKKRPPFNFDTYRGYVGDREIYRLNMERNSNSGGDSAQANEHNSKVTTLEKYFTALAMLGEFASVEEFKKRYPSMTLANGSEIKDSRDLNRFYTQLLAELPSKDSAKNLLLFQLQSLFNDLQSAAVDVGFCSKPATSVAPVAAGAAALSVTPATNADAHGANSSAPAASEDQARSARAKNAIASAKVDEPLPAHSSALRGVDLPVAAPFLKKPSAFLSGAPLPSGSGERSTRVTKIIDDIINTTRFSKDPAERDVSCVSVTTNIGRNKQEKAMPVGYQRFMAWNFARNMCQPADDVFMKEPKKEEFDALTSNHFASKTENPLAHGYTVLYGLGAQESSGNPLQPNNIGGPLFVREAGMMQLSPNSLIYNPSEAQILAGYLQKLERPENQEPQAMAQICGLNDPLNKSIFTDKDYFHEQNYVRDEGGLVSEDVYGANETYRQLKNSLKLSRDGHQTRASKLLLNEMARNRLLPDKLLKQQNALKAKVELLNQKTASASILRQIKSLNEDIAGLDKKIAKESRLAVREVGFLNTADGAEFSKYVKAMFLYCPAFTADAMLATARLNRDHNGPLKDDSATGYAKMSCGKMFDAILSRKAEICGNE